MSYMTPWLETVAREAGINLEHGKQLAMLYALLAKTKQAHVTGEDVHDAWVLWTECVGDDPKHEYLVPFEQLPVAEQNYEDEYARAAHKTFQQLG